MTSILADTNIFVRMINADDPQHGLAVDAVDFLTNRGDQVCVVPQVLYEFWVVCTRSAGPRPEGENGLGMTHLEAAVEFSRLVALFPVLQDNDQILQQWFDLVRNQGVLGRQAHDARLVAAMQVHGITHLLTFNGRHFERYSEITVVHPSEVSTLFSDE